jgi:hypothetical protein
MCVSAFTWGVVRLAARRKPGPITLKNPIGAPAFSRRGRCPDPDDGPARDLILRDRSDDQ